MLKVEVNGKFCKIGINGSLMDIIRDVVIMLDKTGDAIAENNEEGATIFNHFIGMFARGKAMGVPAEDILKKTFSTLEKMFSENDKKDADKEKKSDADVSIEDLLKELKEHLEE